MKRTFIRIGSILLIASLFFNACKKADMPASESTVTENGVLSGKGPANSSSFTDEPTGTLEVTEEQFNQLNEEQYLEAKLVEPHSYVAGKPIPWPWPTIDPCAQDWIDFANFMNTWRPYMVAWANANCKPFRGCWSGRCGLCITYQVNPTIPCGHPVEYDRYVKVFE